VVCTGEMLRICTKYEALARLMWATDRFDLLFSHFSVPHFDISADSFATFRELVLNAPKSASRSKSRRLSNDYTRHSSKQIMRRAGRTSSSSWHSQSSNRLI
jgi:hypothetical protein